MEINTHVLYNRKCSIFNPGPFSNQLGLFTGVYKYNSQCHRDLLSEGVFLSLSALKFDLPISFVRSRPQSLYAWEYVVQKVLRTYPPHEIQHRYPKLAMFERRYLVRTITFGYVVSMLNFGGIQWVALQGGSHFVKQLPCSCSSYEFSACPNEANFNYWVESVKFPFHSHSIHVKYIFPLWLNTYTILWYYCECWKILPACSNIIWT